MIIKILIVFLFVVIATCLTYVNAFTMYKYDYHDSCYNCGRDCQNFKEKNISKPQKKKKRTIKIIFK